MLTDFLSFSYIFAFTTNGIAADSGEIKTDDFIVEQPLNERN